MNKFLHPGFGYAISSVLAIELTKFNITNKKPTKPKKKTKRFFYRCSIVSCGKEFKLKSHLARHYAQAHGLAVRSGSPRPIMKTRTAFYMHANIMTRLSRILCRHLIKSKKAARQPSFVINTHLVRQECKFDVKD